MKISDSNIYLVVNIFGEPSFNNDLYTSIEEANENVLKNSIHNDNDTQYELIPLSYYQLALIGRCTLLEAFNNYHRD